jgi:hypothetical protein
MLSPGLMSGLFARMICEAAARTEDCVFLRSRWKVLASTTLSPGVPFSDLRPDDSCDSEGILKIGNQTYFKSADGTIMPTAKDQPPPDLRYSSRRRSSHALRVR